MSRMMYITYSLQNNCMHRCKHLLPLMTWIYWWNTHLIKLLSAELCHLVLIQCNWCHLAPVLHVMSPCPDTPCDITLPCPSTPCDVTMPWYSMWCHRALILHVMSPCPDTPCDVTVPWYSVVSPCPDTPYDVTLPWHSMWCYLAPVLQVMSPCPNTPCCLILHAVLPCPNTPCGVTLPQYSEWCHLALIFHVTPPCPSAPWHQLSQSWSWLWFYSDLLLLDHKLWCCPHVLLMPSFILVVMTRQWTLLMVCFSSFQTERCDQRIQPGDLLRPSSRQGREGNLTLPPNGHPASGEGWFSEQHLQTRRHLGLGSGVTWSCFTRLLLTLHFQLGGMLLKSTTKLKELMSNWSFFIFYLFTWWAAGLKACSPVSAVDRKSRLILCIKQKMISISLLSSQTVPCNKQLFIISVMMIRVVEMTRSNHTDSISCACTCTLWWVYVCKQSPDNSLKSLSVLVWVGQPWRKPQLCYFSVVWERTGWKL